MTLPTPPTNAYQRPTNALCVPPPIPPVRWKRANAVGSGCPIQHHRRCSVTKTEADAMSARRTPVQSKPRRPDAGNQRSLKI